MSTLMQWWIGLCFLSWISAQAPLPSVAPAPIDEPEWVKNANAQIDSFTGSAFWLHNLPRSTPGAKKGRNSPLGLDVDGPYFEPFVSIFVFTAVFGMLMIVAGVVACIVRYQCECCGGGKPNADGYSAIGALWPRIALPVFGALFVILAIMAISGNGRFNTAVSGVTVDIVARGAQEQVSVNVLVDELVRIDKLPVPYDCSPNCNRTVRFSQVLVDYRKSGQEVADNADTTPNVVKGANAGRLAVLGLYLVALFIMSILGFLAAAIRSSRFAAAAASCAFVFMSIACINTGISFTVAMGSADWCLVNETSLLTEGAMSMVASEDAIANSNAQTNVGGMFTPVDNGAGGKVLQLLTFMLLDANRQAYYNRTRFTPQLSVRVAGLQAVDTQLLKLRNELARQRAGVWVVDAFVAHRDPACGGALSGNMLIAAVSLTTIFLAMIYAVVAFMAEPRFAFEKEEDFELNTW